MVGTVLTCACVRYRVLGMMWTVAMRLGEPKLKLYRDINGVLKGDGLCCYLKVESVQLALQILDGDEFRGHKIKVERVGYKVLSQSSFLTDVIRIMYVGKFSPSFSCSSHLILLHFYASSSCTSNEN